VIAVTDSYDDEKTIVGDRTRESLDEVIPGAPPVEPIELVFDRETLQRGQSMGSDPYRALEIWTQNRVYFVDSTLCCVEVVDRKTGMREPKHSVLGARLAGGQRQYGKTMHLARPFPVPGTEAVFERASAGRRVPAGVTSKVEKVVLHIRVTSFVMETEGAWDDVTAALLHPSFGFRRE
jgi:hypothetical protein